MGLRNAKGATATDSGRPSVIPPGAGSTGAGGSRFSPAGPNAALMPLKVLTRCLGDGFGHLLLLVGRRQETRLLPVRAEPHLDQHRGHERRDEDGEAGLFDTAIGAGMDLPQ